MKTIAEIKAFWSALPDSAVFASHFDHAVETIEQTAQDAQRAEAAAQAAKVRHKHAIAALRDRVESAASADWSPAEIDTARRAALRQAFAVAEGAAAPQELTVERHRRLAREAIGF